MRAVQRGTAVAARNANDFISLAQATEGVLGQATGMLQRLREIAVQSANGTLQPSDHASLQQEADQLVAEIDRLGKSTQFNGVQLLDGSFEQMTLQIGAGSGDRLKVGKLIDLRATELPTTDVSYSVNDNLFPPALRPTPQPVPPVVPPLADSLPAIPGGLTVADADGVPVALGAIGKALTGAQRLGQVAAAINAVSGTTGIWADLSAGTAPGSYKMTLVSNRAIGAGDFGGFSASETGLDSGSIADGPILAEPITEVDLSTSEGARLALPRYDKAIDQVSAARAKLGALQSRFESIVGGLALTDETVQAARGRIVDADYGAEAVERSRSAILQQSGIALMVQANVMPRLVLQLLQAPGSG
jgi:flagellin